MLAWLSLLIGQQILSRAATFFLNVAITRYLRVEQFGATMSLSLLESTVLFVCREPLRRIVIRTGTGEYIQSCINSAWIISIPCSIIFTMIVLLVRSIEVNDDMFLCLALFCLGLVVDMISEPFYLKVTASGRIPARVAIESISAIVKIVITFALVMPPLSLGFLAYGWAQLGYALTKLLLFAIECHKWVSALPLPTRLANGKWIERSASELGGNFALQSVEKYLLTEGETLALVTIAKDRHEQGVYAMVQNLGSLIARFIFQPVEEIASLYFSKEKKSTSELHNRISILIKLMLMLGLLAVTFGRSYSFIAIHILYGSGWSLNTNGPQILSLYCFYILFMALNGVTEAFMFATITSDQLKTYNIWVLIPLSLVHVLLSFSFVYFGNRGLIIVNCISMALRISYSLYFMKKSFSMGWKDLIWKSLPDRGVFLILVLISISLDFSQRVLHVSMNPSYTSIATHLLFGCLLLSILGAVVFVRESHFIKECIDLMRKNESKKTSNL